MSWVIALLGGELEHRHDVGLLDLRIVRQNFCPIRAGRQQVKDVLHVDTHPANDRVRECYPRASTAQHPRTRRQDAASCPAARNYVTTDGGTPAFARRAYHAGQRCSSSWASAAA
jgi:hypothetical protein